MNTNDHGSVLVAGHDNDDVDDDDDVDDGDDNDKSVVDVADW